MKAYALMVRNQMINIEWYLDSVWTKRPALEEHIKGLLFRESTDGWEYKIETTILWKI